MINSQAQLETQKMNNRELQKELAALKENNFEGKINTSEEKQLDSSQEAAA